MLDVGFELPLVFWGVAPGSNAPELRLSQYTPPSFLPGRGGKAQHACATWQGLPCQRIPFDQFLERGLAYDYD